MDVYLADTSIWLARRRAPELAERFVDRYARGAIVTCAVVELEGLAGPPDGASYEADLEVVWRPMRLLPLDEAVCRRALEVQRSLAASGTGSHREGPLDFLVAACAELGGATLWHCDPHLAVICAVTGQPAEQELAPVLV